MSNAAALILALVLPWLAPASPPAVTAATMAHGPGKLLSGALIYRDDHDYIAGSRYVVFFRTRGAFAGHTADGSTKPGTLSAADSSDNHDGYAGSIGPGIQMGKCYWWALPWAPRINKKRVGAKIDLRFKLNQTATQDRTTKLRALPAGYQSDSWSKSPSVQRALRSIGCHKS